MENSGSNLLVKDNTDAISGFYYDQQLRQPEMIMSLHPSTVPNEKGGEKTEETDKDGKKKMYVEDYWVAEADNLIESTKIDVGGTMIGYSSIPIAVAVLSEDFQVGVANQFDDTSIVDDITSMVNSVKPLSVYTDYVVKAAGGTAEKMKEWMAKNGTDKISAGLTKAVEWVGNTAGQIGPYLNRAIVVQGSRFSKYNGTGVAFGNLSMKFTLFSDWSAEIIRSNSNDYPGFYDFGEYKWQSCIDKVEKIIPYCVGKYVGGDFNIENKEVRDLLNQFIGWQIPPGGYKPELKNIDNLQYGTLMVVFGGYYCIRNLVVSDAQFNFSKQRIKVPKSANTSPYIETVPMYCDVQLTLKPASKYSDVSFIEAIKGTQVATLRETINNNYNIRLDNLITKEKNYWEKRNSKDKDKK